MAHAVPASGGTGGRHGPAPARHRTAARNRTADTSTDVFGPRVHRAATWALPLVLGLVYGYWAAANRRHGGPVTGWNVLFGFVTALVFIVLYVAVRALAPRLTSGLHALLWGLFAGAALGFLLSQSDQTRLASAGLGLLTAAVVTATLYYHYILREDAAEARRTREATARQNRLPDTARHEAPGAG